MPTFTTFLNLLKPDGTEFVDEDAQLNDNYDALDTFAQGTDNRLNLIEGGGVNYPVYSFVENDTSITSDAVMGDIPDLDAIAVVANSLYLLETNFLLTHPSAASPPGAQFKFTIPVGATYKGSYFTGYLNSDDFANGEGASFYTDNTSILDAVNINPSTVDSSSTVASLLLRTAGTAGNVTAQWRQNISNAAVVTLKKDSFFRLTKLI